MLSKMIIQVPFNLSFLPVLSIRFLTFFNGDLCFLLFPTFSTFFAGGSDDSFLSSSLDSRFEKTVFRSSRFSLSWLEQFVERNTFSVILLSYPSSIYQFKYTLYLQMLGIGE